jgi:hypothetical protein
LRRDLVDLVDHQDLAVRAVGIDGEVTADSGRLIVSLIRAIGTDGLSIVLGECGAGKREGKHDCKGFLQAFSSSIDDSIWLGYMSKRAASPLTSVNQALTRRGGQEADHLEPMRG